MSSSLQVLEYSLFQPGLFLDYFAPPGPNTPKPNQELFIDFQQSRAITIKGKEMLFTVTNIEDLANVVVRAVDYPGLWPVTGGVQGATLSGSQLLKLGTKIKSTYEYPCARIKC